ncbi:L,D-transpeptidase [Phyllobacterium phragmitis]|nr:L,D-transpeptidase [Phyllobacterium phragmitis]
MSVSLTNLGVKVPFLNLSRSVSLTFLSAVVLSSCSTVQTSSKPTPLVASPIIRRDQSPLAFKPVDEPPSQMYRAMSDNNFPIAAVDTSKLNPKHVRQIVDYRTAEPPGTIIVDQKARYLYFVLPEGKAIRYAVGVGPIARAFDGGEAVIARKAEWPRWIPTPSMIARNPAQYAPNKDGVDGGPHNPMGPRALYMHKDGIDTYYRVHGTNDPSSIGKAVSAGCIRLLNQDIIDLYERVKPGARIVVH